MKVYHASNLIVTRPDTVHSRPYLDFGQGFYLTTLKDQASNYGQRFKRRQQEAWLNVYELSENLAAWNILRFESYSREWLDFVVKCRTGEPTGNYDLVIGGIANDRVVATINLFFEHLISKEEALGRLKFEQPNIQYCIRTQRMLDECLTYVESIKL
jgi:hypothetical protein